MANKVLFGLENVYYSILTESTTTYATPVAIPGAVNLTLSQEGGQSIFYADNIAYYVMNTNNGYSGTLEAALLSDTAIAAMLGWETDDNGMLVEISDAIPVPFALLFQVSGDDANRRYAFFKCVASRPAEDHSTKTDTTEPQTQALDLTITPIEIDSTKVVKATIEYSIATATVYNAWFTAVTKPDFTVS